MLGLSHKFKIAKHFHTFIHLADINSSHVRRLALHSALLGDNGFCVSCFSSEALPYSWKHPTPFVSSGGIRAVSGGSSIFLSQTLSFSFSGKFLRVL